jgi:hypothetical protein
MTRLVNLISGAWSLTVAGVAAYWWTAPQSLRSAFQALPVCILTDLATSLLLLWLCPGPAHRKGHTVFDVGVRFMLTGSVLVMALTIDHAAGLPYSFAPSAALIGISLHLGYSITHWRLIAESRSIPVPSFVEHMSGTVNTGHHGGDGADRRRPECPDCAAGDCRKCPVGACPYRREEQEGS